VIVNHLINPAATGNDGGTAMTAIFDIHYLDEEYEPVDWPAWCSQFCPSARAIVGWADGRVDYSYTVAGLARMVKDGQGVLWAEVTMDGYKAPEIEYWLLTRDDEFVIETCVKGGDILYGNGSWSIEAGPFSSWDEAEAAYWFPPEVDNGPAS
jgi:hypothetical protein